MKFAKLCKTINIGKIKVYQRIKHCASYSIDNKLIYFFGDPTKHMFRRGKGASEQKVYVCVEQTNDSETCDVESC